MASRSVPSHATRLPGGICPITGEDYSSHTSVVLDHLHPSLAERIRQDYPALTSDARTSRTAADRYRKLHVEELLRQERGELTQLDEEVARSLAEGAMVSINTEEHYDEARTLGERLSDSLAVFGGSWPFLILFGLMLAVWIMANSVRQQDAFDPYPYILLNLILSCIAAIQAPIIMMSQRRQEAKDRLRSLNDYRVNLKAELEIRHLHEKLDHLITRQWERLAEIQQLQIELLQERR
jgi:uncharacterized membrane protein